VQSTGPVDGYVCRLLIQLDSSSCQSHNTSRYTYRSSKQSLSWLCSLFRKDHIRRGSMSKTSVKCWQQSVSELGHGSKQNCEDNSQDYYITLSQQMWTICAISQCSSSSSILAVTSSWQWHSTITQLQVSLQVFYSVNLFHVSLPKKTTVSTSLEANMTLMLPVGTTCRGDNQLLPPSSTH